MSTFALASDQRLAAFGVVQLLLCAFACQGFVSPAPGVCAMYGGHHLTCNVRSNMICNMPNTIFALLATLSWDIPVACEVWLCLCFSKT